MEHPKVPVTDRVRLSVPSNSRFFVHMCMICASKAIYLLVFYWWKRYTYKNFKQNKRVDIENKPIFCSTSFLQYSTSLNNLLFFLLKLTYAYSSIYIFYFPTNMKHTGHIPLLFAFLHLMMCCFISEHYDPPILFIGSIAFHFMDEP